MSRADVYLNGEWTPHAAAALPVWDYGVVQGATVTDMVRTFRGEPFQLDEHLDRFRNSREALGIQLPENDVTLSAIVREVISRGRLEDPQRDVGVLLFATPGSYRGYAPASSNASKSRPTLCVHPFALNYAHAARGYRFGVSLVTPQVRQLPNECVSARIKFRSRLHWYLAEREAKAADPEASALLTDFDGHLTETNSGNLFVARGGKLLTPRAEGTLPGVSRKFVLDLAASAGLPALFADLTIDGALAADEAFLSSTTYCLLPVTRLNSRPIGDGRPGPIFRRLIKLWSDAVGVDIPAQAETLAGP